MIKWLKIFLRLFLRVNWYAIFLLGGFLAFQAAIKGEWGELSSPIPSRFGPVSGGYSLPENDVWIFWLLVLMVTVQITILGTIAAVEIAKKIKSGQLFIAQDGTSIPRLLTWAPAAMFILFLFDFVYEPEKTQPSEADQIGAFEAFASGALKMAPTILFLLFFVAFGWEMIRLIRRESQKNEEE